MIRINLLPKVEIKKPKRGVGEIFIGTLALLVVLGVILATHFTQSGKINKTNDEIRITDKKIEDLKDVEAQVNEFKAKNKELERRIQIIADLEKRRSGPLYVMDSLSTAIPTRSWIDDVKSKGIATSINGIAWNEFTVSEFMKNLQKSDYFTNVKLKVIKQKDVSSLPLRQFEITSDLNFLGKSKKDNKEDNTEINTKSNESEI